MANRHGKDTASKMLSVQGRKQSKSELQRARGLQVSDDMHAHKDPHSPSHLSRSGPYQEMPADLTALLCRHKGEEFGELGFGSQWHGRSC